MTFVLILLVGCQILSILVATIAVSVTDKTTYDATTANATVPRGALILTMAGPGAPSYLQASCLSMASSAARFDMLIFHEDNEVISTMLCAPNVKKINLHQHGLSRLISAAICQAGGAPDAAVTARTRIKDAASPDHNSSAALSTCRELETVLKHVLALLPYYLAEFKIGSGDIFAKYLTRYTHWSYTDPDIIWGNLSSWLTDDELSSYDVITLSKFNDARRLFLRGQFSLHRNTPVLNRQWSRLPHLTAAAVLARMRRSTTLLREGSSVARLKSLTFISAEGAYSSLIFRSRLFRVLVTGRMMSDRVTKPVVLTGGALWRCHCDTVAKCAASAQENMSRCFGPPPPLQALHMPMALVPLHTTRGRGTGRSQCAMGWLVAADQLCGVVPPRVLANDAVLLKGQVEWMLNNDTAAPRSAARSGALFHFRLWEDELSSSLQKSNDEAGDGRSSCLIAYLDLGMQVMHLASCAAAALAPTVPVLSHSEWLRAKRHKRAPKQGTERADTDTDNGAGGAGTSGRGAVRVAEIGAGAGPGGKKAAAREGNDDFFYTAQRQ